MPKQIIRTLGGREYTFTEKTMGINAAWRKKLRESSVMRVLESLDSLIDDLVAMVNSVPEGGSLSDIDMGKAFRVARILPAAINALAGSVDEITDLLFEYEPKLKTDRKWLESHAYDEEVINAFLGMLTLLFPIMGVWETITGSRVRPTPGNSASANGDLNGLPASGPKKKALTSS